MAGSRRSPGTAARTSATQDGAPVGEADKGSGNSLLGGCRVLDLGDLSGAVCGRILADLGADVVKVEPPGGEADRLQPPFVDDVENRERSIPWLAANVNKRGVTCDLGSPQGRDLFARLAATARIVVESFPPGRVRDLGLEAVLRDTIVVSITPYGQDGPLARVPASDLEVTAASGSLWLAGEEGRPPVRTTQPQSPYWSGMYGALGALIALQSPVAQRVDVSAQAAMTTVHPPAPVWWDIAREEHGRTGPFLLGRSNVGSRFRNLWACADGFVSFAIQGGPIGRHTGRMLADWMAEGGRVPAVIAAIDWDRFDNTTLSQPQVDALEAAIAPFLRSLTKAEFFDEVVKRKMLGYPVGDASDSLADPQLRARDFWRTLSPAAGLPPLPFPGGFALFDGERPAVRRSAPGVGEHNAEIYGEAGVGPEELARLAAAGVV
jgi:crotonobetainyl-CoA:carnitine CoA-transferase CaiB-like acyl-CoA transferase